MNRPERLHAAALCGLLIVRNAAAWGWAAVACRSDSALPFSPTRSGCGTRYVERRRSRARSS